MISSLEDLTWNLHVSNICMRVHSVLECLRHRDHFLSWKVNKLLVNALVLPLFDYACLVFCDLSGYLVTKLQRLLNFAVRFIFRLGRDAALSGYYAKLNWLTVASRRKYFMAVRIYKLFAQCRPSLNALFPDAEC